MPVLSATRQLCSRLSGCFLLKCPYGLQGFCGFGIPVTSKMYSNQKMNSDAFFAMKSSFKFVASATPNEIYRVMKDW